MTDLGRPSGSDGAAKRVIVIDDSEIVLESIKDALLDVGCDVVTMTEPSRSTFVGEQPADLILLDVNMPQAFGDDIARFLRDAWGMPSPIYLYSSLTAEELEERARDAGADGYICKSWGKERLVERVREILGLEPPAKGASSQEGDGEPADALSGSAADIADRREHAQTVYHRFARRCQDRNNEINSHLDGLPDMDPESAARAVHAVALHLHDFVGEAKLLGLDRVAAAASSLKGLLEAWGIELTQAAYRERFRESLERLTSLAERCAHDSPDADLLRELNSLRSELDSELGAESSDTPAPDSDAEEPAQLLRILVFDDSPIVGEVLSLELESRGHDVALAATLAEFNKSLIEFAPELIFLDVNMPEISGTELCQHLRQHHLTQKLPIIFLSSLPDGELAKLAKKWGADGYLSKQRGMEELIKYLDELLIEIIF